MTDFKNKESNSFSPSNDSSQDSFSFPDIILVLARQIKIIVVAPVIFLIIALIYNTYYVIPIYKSKSKIISSSNTGGGSQISSIASQFGLSFPSSQNEITWVYPEIIKSRTLAKSILRRSFETQKLGHQKTLLQILTYEEGVLTVGIDTLMNAGVNKLHGMIDVKQSGYFYDLTISAKEPKLARDIAIVLIEELHMHQKSYNKSKANDTRKFIDARIIETEKELQKAEEALKDFKDRNRRIENSPALQLEQQRFSREVSVLTSVFTTLKQHLETTKIEQVKESDYVIVLDPPVAPLYPSSPNKRFVAILAVVFGLAVGVFFAFLLDLFINSEDTEMQKLKNAKYLFLNNILGLVPRTLKKRK
jgi:uncharacterized protein involved in exopolysaccharide biosynthesis